MPDNCPRESINVFHICFMSSFRSRNISQDHHRQILTKDKNLHDIENVPLLFLLPNSWEDRRTEEECRAQLIWRTTPRVLSEADILGPGQDPNWDLKSREYNVIINISVICVSSRNWSIVAARIGMFWRGLTQPQRRGKLKILTFLCTTVTRLYFIYYNQWQ